MTMLEARMTLVRLVWDLLSERGLETKEFLEQAGSFEPSSLQRYLKGYVRLHPNQLVDIIEILQPHEALERHMLVLCFAQFYGGHVVELLERNLRPEGCECECSTQALDSGSDTPNLSRVQNAINAVSEQAQERHEHD